MNVKGMSVTITIEKKHELEINFLLLDPGKPETDSDGSAAPDFELHEIYWDGTEVSSLVDRFGGWSVIEEMVTEHINGMQR
jgi:hypothetical protein